MNSSDHPKDNRSLSRPCDNAEYGTKEKNEIGQRLGQTLHRVFCDLHDVNQMDLLSESTGLDHRELFEKLYISERYSANQGDWSMNQFYYEVLGTTEPHRFDETSGKWKMIDPIPALTEVVMSSDDHDLASILLSGDDFRPSFLVGRVGSGKTTFLKRFITYIAPNVELLANFVFLHLDFARGEIGGKYFKTQQKDEPFDLALDFVLTEYFNMYLGGLPPLKDVFEYTYKTENIERTIETWPEEIRNEKRQEWYRLKRDDLNEFNYARIKYLQNNCKKRVVVCIDNADLWDMVEQKELIKNALFKQTWHGSGLLIIVRHNALTELQRHLCYSQFRPFEKHLTPPRIDHVLRQRLNLLLTIVQKSDRGPYSVLNYPLGARVLFNTNEQLVDFLQNIAKSLTTGEAEEFIRCFANHNVRRMLDFAEIYLTSSNTEIWRYLPLIVKPLNDYSNVGFWDQGSVGLHSVIATAALGHGKFYHPVESSLCNIFSNNSATEPFDMLIRLRILEFVNMRDATHQAMLFQGLKEVGYSNEQIQIAVSVLVKDDGLIETREQLTDPNAILFATVAGKYYLRKLIHRLAYVQNMRDGSFLPGIETPIGTQIELEKRLLSVAEFIEYLNEQEIAERERGLSLNPTSYRKYCGGSGCSIPGIAKHLYVEIQRIKVNDRKVRKKTLNIIKKVADRCENF